MPAILPDNHSMSDAVSAPSTPTNTSNPRPMAETVLPSTPTLASATL
jgi:hypothetical protein